MHSASLVVSILRGGVEGTAAAADRACRLAELVAEQPVDLVRRHDVQQVYRVELKRQ